MFFKDKPIVTTKFILIILSAIIFLALLPLYTFDSYWYISYLDHFDGTVPMSEWNAVRGFVFPTLLYIAHLIHPGNIGIEIVFLVIYLLYHYGIFKVYGLYKKSIGDEEHIYELVLLDVLFLYSPIIWTYSHRVLTEGIAYPIFVFYLFCTIRYYLKQIKGRQGKKETIIFWGISAICAILSWYLKQSFVVYIITVFIGVSLFILLRKKKTKIVLISLVALVCLCIGWKVSLNHKNELNQTNPLVVGVDTSLKLRYFVIGEGNVVEVKNDDYETIDTFVFESANLGLARDIDYFIACSRHGFKRLVRGLIDDYMIMTSTYYSPIGYGAWIGYDNGYVVRDGMLEPIKGHNPGKQSENERLCFIELKEPTNYYEDIDYQSIELNERGIRTDRLAEYGYVGKTNIITRLISWKYFWAFSEGLFVVSLLFAIWCWLPCGVVAVIRRNPIIDILAINTVACFAFLSAHVYIGAAIERYSVPVYVTELLCCVCTIITIKDKILNRGIDNA